MNHYVTSDNKLWGFDETQAHLIPKNAVLIPKNFTMAQIPYITLVNGVVIFDQDKYDSDIAEQQAIKQAQETAKASALAKLSALGLTADEVKALIG